MTVLVLVLLSSVGLATPPLPPPVPAAIERCMAQDACRALLLRQATVQPMQDSTAIPSWSALPPRLGGIVRRDFSEEMEDSLWMLAMQERPAATEP